jgi:hypothetical protein
LRILSQNKDGKAVRKQGKNVIEVDNGELGLSFMFLKNTNTLCILLG